MEENSVSSELTPIETEIIGVWVTKQDTLKIRTATNCEEIGGFYATCSVMEQGMIKLGRFFTGNKVEIYDKDMKLFSRINLKKTYNLSEDEYLEMKKYVEQSLGVDNVED